MAKKLRKYAWLKEYDSIALQQAVLNLNTAFDNFFNPKLRARFPTFKRRHGKQSSYHCVGVKMLEGAIKIPKLSPIEARLHRDIISEVKSITLSRTPTGKYFASILCGDGKDAPAKPEVIDVSRITGCDLGLTHFLIRSDNVKQANPRYLIRASQNLRRKQSPGKSEAAKIGQKRGLSSPDVMKKWATRELTSSTNCPGNSLTKTKR